MAGAAAPAVTLMPLYGAGTLKWLYAPGMIVIGALVADWPKAVAPVTVPESPARRSRMANVACPALSVTVEEGAMVAEVKPFIDGVTTCPAMALLFASTRLNVIGVAGIGHGDEAQ